MRETQRFGPRVGFWLLSGLSCSPGILQVQIQCPLRGNQEDVVSDQVHHCLLHVLLVRIVTPRLCVDTVCRVGSTLTPVHSKSFDQIVELVPEKTNSIKSLQTGSFKWCRAHGNGPQLLLMFTSIPVVSNGLVK